MSTATKTMTKRLGFLAALTAVAVLLLGAASASAAVGPKWRIESVSNTTAAPGEEFEYMVETRDIGDQDMNGNEIVLTADLPAGLTVQSAIFDPDADPAEEGLIECTAGDGVSPVAGASHVKCISFTALPFKTHFQRLRLEVKAALAAAGTLTVSFAVSGGGDPLGDATVDPTTIAPEPPPFGVDAFDNQLFDSSGEPSTTAGAHPAELLTSLDWNTHNDPAPQNGTATPVEPVKDAFVELPPGLVGNPAVLDTCTTAQLAASKTLTARTLCPATSQVGVVVLRNNGHFLAHPSSGPSPSSTWRPRSRPRPLRRRHRRNHRPPRCLRPLRRRLRHHHRLGQRLRGHLGRRLDLRLLG